MQDIEKVRRLERRHEKFKMRLAMQQNRQVLGQTRGAKALERTSLDWNTTFKGRNYVTRFDSQITAETNDMIDNETIVE
jgi:hypothetical protein